MFFAVRVSCSGDVLDTALIDVATNDLGYDYYGRVNNLLTFVKPDFWISYSVKKRSYYQKISQSGTVLDSTGKVILTANQVLASAQCNGQGYIVMSYIKEKPDELLFHRVDPATGSITDLPSFISKNAILSPSVFTEEINGKSLVAFTGWTDKINTTYVDTWRTKASFYINNSTGIVADNSKAFLSNKVLIYRNPVNRSFIFRFDHDGSMVNINIYNALGKQVRSIHQQTNGKTKCKILWDGKDNSDTILPAGVYLVHLSTKEFTFNSKICMF